jgi:GntR family transcriptional regulator
LAGALRVEPATALLRLECLTHRGDGVPLDFEYLYFRGDTFQYRLRISRQAAGASAAVN